MSTEIHEGTAVARGVYWDDSAGGQRLRVLSVGGTYWRAGMAEPEENDPDPQHAAMVAAAADAALTAAGIDSTQAITIGRDGGGAWCRDSEQTPNDYGRLHVELTASELVEVASGRMPAAVRIRIKRAIDANVERPTRYSHTLPAVCKVSTRGRRGAAGEAKPKPAPLARLADAITRPNGQPYYPRLVGDRLDVDLIREAHAQGLSVLMHGAPGTGKTAALEAAFATSGFEYVSGTADTIVDDLVGGFVPEPGGTFRWVDGPLLRAMESGVPLIIDEVAMIDPRILTIVYAPMDGRGELVITQNQLRGTVKAQAGFGIHGACNPDAPGSMMSEALTSRFVAQVEYGTDYALAQRLGAPAAVVAAARNLEAKRLTGETTYAPQMRELLAYVKVSKLFGEETALSNLVGCAPVQDRGIVAEIVSRSLGREITPLRIGE